MEVTRPNQVWVSDISYIRTISGFCYLAPITDMYSRKIVGYDISDSLELDGCVRALNKAVYQAKDIKGLIHHSDRGIQYCSNVYTQILKRKKIGISMTEENHCYENAMAERVNGILKDEFYLDQTFTNLAHAKRATKNAINLYNEIRLHLSLDMKTPADVHDFSTRPFPERIPNFDYDSKYKVLKVTKNGSIRWKSYYWVYVTAALMDKYVAIEDIGNGIWKVFYRNVLLGFFDERHLRNKQQSTRLETNLV